MADTRFRISEAVKRALTADNLTADAVLREALGIKTDGLTTSEGVSFPEGTVFVAWYKERAHGAIIRNGLIEIDGNTFTSVSGAAAHITGRPTTNGWAFWMCKFPGKSEFTPIISLRSVAS